MAYQYNDKLVIYYPELENPCFKLLQKRLIENSRADTFEQAALEWIPLWRMTIGDNAREQCICSKHIINLHYIDNKITETTLMLGSCCIKRFLPVIVTCKECDTHLKNIAQRLKENNNKCNTCKKKRIKALSKYKLIGGKLEFRDLIKYEINIEFITNKCNKTKNDLEFIEYITLLLPPAIVLKYHISIEV